jgi:hypothetical protein
VSFVNFCTSNMNLIEWKINTLRQRFVPQTFCFWRADTLRTELSEFILHIQHWKHYLVWKNCMLGSGECCNLALLQLLKRWLINGFNLLFKYLFELMANLFYWK